MSKIKNIITQPLAEMLIVLLCALAAEWAILPFTKNAFVIALPILITVAVVFFSHRRNHETLKELGYRFDNFIECFRFLTLPMLAASVFLIFIGWLNNSLRFSDLFGVLLFKKYIWLFLWALFQQHFLQAFFNRRAQKIWGRGFLSVLITASIFALLHLPNFWLMTATFFGGLLWTMAYQRVPNLFALAVSHGIMSSLLVMTMPPNILHGLRVGYNYFRL